MSRIPEDWNYKWRPTLLNPFRQIPYSWLIEHNHNNCYQTLCPNCDYGKGFNRMVLMMDNLHYKEEKCDTCNCIFWTPAV